MLQLLLNRECFPEDSGGTVAFEISFAYPCNLTFSCHRDKQKEKREGVQRQLKILSRRLESAESANKSLSEMNHLLERLAKTGTTRVVSQSPVSLFLIHLKQSSQLPGHMAAL